MSAKNGIVRLEDLPEDRVCVKLPKNLQKEGSKICGSRLKLAKTLKSMMGQFTILNIADSIRYLYGLLKKYRNILLTMV